MTIGRGLPGPDPKPIFLTAKGWAVADGALGRVLLGPAPCRGCGAPVVYRRGLGWCDDLASHSCRTDGQA